MKYKSCYVWSEDLIKETDRLPAVLRRASLVHSLIEAYGLLSQMQIVRSVPASFENLKRFHSDIYLNHLKTIQCIDEEEYEFNSQDEEFGLGYDCQPVSHMYNLVSVIAGGSLTACNCLLQGVADNVINWCGGWHHAQRFAAEGFCYVNDIVLAIESLRSKFSKVLYIDLDVHHGNGVQDAYNISKSVFTLSFHKFEPGFFPGTGDVADLGNLVGKGYSANVPLLGHYADDTFIYAFERVFSLVFNSFEPDAIVIQCGADALVSDPLGGASLTEEAYVRSIKFVLDKKKPTLFLGGGGYEPANAARLWARLTAEIIGISLDSQIPEHENWTKYGPDYVLSIKKSLARDPNKKSDIDGIIKTIKDNLKTASPKIEYHNLNTNTKNRTTNITSYLTQRDSECSTTGTKDIYEFDDD